MGVVLMADDFLMNMGRRLFERRKQLNLTQEDVANKTNLSLQTISTAELGKKGLRPENILKVCVALDISVDYLLSGELPVEDYSLLYKEVGKLSETQYLQLKQIIRSFLIACGVEDADD